MALHTATFTTVLSRPTIVANSSGSTGTLTVETKIGDTWTAPAVIGVIQPGDVKQIELPDLILSMDVRFLVTGSVNYEVI